MALTNHSRLGYTQIAANLADEKVVDFAVPGHGGNLIVGGIDEDAMLAAFT